MIKPKPTSTLHGVSGQSRRPLLLIDRLSVSEAGCTNVRSPLHKRYSSTGHLTEP